MKMVPFLAAVGEAATGVALLIVPSLVGWLLLGEELTGVAIPVARVAGARIIGMVHDEIILEVPEKMADRVATILRETMIQAGRTCLSKVPVEVDVTIRETWAEK